MKKYGLLSEERPELSKEWDFESNAPLTPSDVTLGSGKNVWWNCKKRPSHPKWRARVSNRALNKRSSCPLCDKEARRVKGDTKSLKKARKAGKKARDAKKVAQGIPLMGLYSGYQTQIRQQKQEFCPRCDGYLVFEGLLNDLPGQLAGEMSFYVEFEDDDRDENSCPHCGVFLEVEP